MKKYSSIYELEAELKAQGYRTTPELDLTIPANDDSDDPCLQCDDGWLYYYPKHKFYTLSPKKDNIIVVRGYLTNAEEGHGKTALWCDGRIEIVTNYNPNSYAYPSHNIDAELKKANSFLWQLAQKEGWVIIPVAAAELIESIVQ